MDQWEQFAQNIKGAQAAMGGPQNMYQTYADTGVINASPARFAGGQAAVQARNEENAARINDQIASVREQQKSLAEDPSKAYMKLGEDGRYRYYKGNGEAININQFSLMTGKRPDEILADSENPADQKFVRDYQTMRAFTDAWINGDNDTLKRFRASDPKRYEQLLSTYKSPNDMVKAFRNYYTDYYGNTAGTQEKPGQMFTSSSFNPKFDFSPDKNDPAGKAVANLMANSSLADTMNVNLPQAPKQENWYDPFVPFAQYFPDTYRRKQWEYEQAQKSNPWLAYNKYLGGQ